MLTKKFWYVFLITILPTIGSSFLVNNLPSLSEEIKQNYSVLILAGLFVICFVIAWLNLSSEKLDNLEDSLTKVLSKFVSPEVLQKLGLEKSYYYKDEIIDLKRYLRDEDLLNMVEKFMEQNPDQKRENILFQAIYKVKQKYSQNKDKELVDLLLNYIYNGLDSDSSLVLRLLVLITYPKLNFKIKIDNKIFEKELEQEPIEEVGVFELQEIIKNCYDNEISNNTENRVMTALEKLEKIGIIKINKIPDYHRFSYNEKGFSKILESPENEIEIFWEKNVKLTSQMETIYFTVTESNERRLSINYIVPVNYDKIIVISPDLFKFFDFLFKREILPHSHLTIKSFYKKFVLYHNEMAENINHNSFLSVDGRLSIIAILFYKSKTWLKLREDVLIHELTMIQNMSESYLKSELIVEILIEIEQFFGIRLPEKLRNRYDLK